ncbi:MAG: hypothetical protein M3P18_02870, partial [Actinomycetota bacterium]|nr:hypothetical protein [Actinomycetota bacterium]
LTASRDETWAKAWRRAWREHPEILIEQRRTRHGTAHLGLTPRQVEAYARGSFYGERFARPIREVRSRRPV